MNYPHRHHSPSKQLRAGVFISYARSDGEAFAHRLRERLEKQHIKLWQDRVALEGGRDWWLQITAALDQVTFMALVVTPNALKSEIVRKEWRYARQQGVCVYPIKGAPNLDFNSLPRQERWLRDQHFYDLGTLAGDDCGPEWQKFLNDLNKTPDVRRVPFMVEDLPTGFVQRPNEFDQLIALLLDENRADPVAITAALRGAGGYGKTTIAKALCHDERIQDAFDDGILWVTLGENPGDPTGRVEDLIQTLSGARPGFSNTEAAIARLKELLADRDLLIVIDDVWNRDHLRPFMQGGSRCARLVTTRNPHTLPDRAVEIPVDAMRQAEAVALLSGGLEERQGDKERGRGGEGEKFGNEVTDGLRALAARLGEWPLLLKLANGVLRQRVKSGETLPKAIVYANRALDKRGLKAFDDRNPVERSQAVEATLRVSLEQLTDDEEERFYQLAIFPEDVPVPLPTLENYWGLDDLDTEDFCDRLNQCSLLHSYDLGARTLRLHDVIRTFLRDARQADLPALNNQLLDAHRPADGWTETPHDDRYFWDHLADHLIEAGRGEELVATVKEWRYLAKKIFLRKAHSVEYDLLKAETCAPADDPLRTLRRGISVSSHLVNRSDNQRDIDATLLARLHHLTDLTAMVQDLAQNLSRPHLAPQSALPDLPHPALIRTLEGHADSVNGCAFSADGQFIVSASADNTLKVWEVRTGEMLRTLEGHTDSVKGCAFSPDGQFIVSISNDRTLKVWEARTGAMLRSLEGHAHHMWGGAFSSDGQFIVSASPDIMRKVWEVHTHAMLRSLEGHAHNMYEGCAVSPDGQFIVSALIGERLKVWHAHSGEILCLLEGHRGGVSGCAFSSDGQFIVSASYDNTLKVWNARTGAMLCLLEGHADSVNGCAFSADGQFIVSASADNTLKVWETRTGAIPRSLEGQANPVRGCAFSPDGQFIVSASDDRTLKVWEARTGAMLRSLEGHKNWVLGCAFSPDGEFIVSASADDTLKIWEARTGAMLRSLKGHAGPVMGCAFSPDGQFIVSASADDTLKIWEARTGAMLRSLKGHTSLVRGCAFSPDGQFIVSASSDGTLKVWDALTGQRLRSLKSHEDVVNGCAFSPDGQFIVSAFAGGTLEVWDALTGQLLRSLAGHARMVTGCAFSPDGQLIVSTSDDHTLKVWDALTGDCRATFFAEGEMICCAIHSEMIAAGGDRGLYFLRLVR